MVGKFNLDIANICKSKDVEVDMINISKSSILIVNNFYYAINCLNERVTVKKIYWPNGFKSF